MLREPGQDFGMTDIIVAGASTAIAASLAYPTMLFAVADRFTRPRRVPPRAWPSELTADVYRVEFFARGDAMPIAAWYRPARSAIAAVIMVHGRDACRGDAVRGGTFALAERIAADGMSVLMIDLRGHGESGDARLTFGHHERLDVLGAVDFLLSRGYEPKRIGVFGASMGGASGIAAAAEESAIGALVTDSAFADLEGLLRDQFRRLTRLPSWCLRGALLAARLLTGIELTTRAPRDLIRSLTQLPILIIHAADDPFVPVQHARWLAAAGQTDLWITSGSRHLASSDTEGARYAEVVASFFTNALCHACTSAHA